MLLNWTWHCSPAAQQCLCDIGLWWRKVRNLFAGHQARSNGGSCSKRPEHLSGFQVSIFVVVFPRVTPVAYGGSQARGPIRATGASLCHRHTIVQIQATSVAYTIAHGNTRSLTHWARPGFEHTTSWFLVGFVNHWAMTGTPRAGIFKGNIWVRAAKYMTFFWLVGGEVTGWCIRNLSHQPSGSNQSEIQVLVVSM